MADKSFGVKDINLIGASGTPEIESPNNLNIKAVNVAISTDMSVGGALTVTGDLTVNGTTTTIDTAVTAVDSLSVDGAASFAGSNVDIDSTGQITIKKTASFTDPSFRILDRNNSNANGVLMYGNGSATFAGGAANIYSNGTIRVGGNPGSASTIGADLNNDGSIRCRSSNSSALRVFPNSSSTNEVASISNTGSASLAAGAFAIESDGDISTNVRCHGHIELDSTGTFTNPKIKLFSNTGTGTFGSFDDSSSTGYGVKINLAANAGDVRAQCQQTASQYTRLFDGLQGTNTVFSVLANGNLTVSGNVTAANVSDIRFKENITDANPQLADAVALGSQLKNFDWKDNAPLNEELRAKRFLGLVAQEAEKVCPGLTYTVPRTKQGAELTPETTDAEGNVTPATYEELDDSYKAINHDILVMKLLGAVAEQNTRIETLEAKVAALEG